MSSWQRYAWHRLAWGAPAVSPEREPPSAVPAVPALRPSPSTHSVARGGLDVRDDRLRRRLGKHGDREIAFALHPSSRVVKGGVSDGGSGRDAVVTRQQLLHLGDQQLPLRVTRPEPAFACAVDELTDEGNGHMLAEFLQQVRQQVCPAADRNAGHACARRTGGNVSGGICEGVGSYVGETSDGRFGPRTFGRRYWTGRVPVTSRRCKR